MEHQLRLIVGFCRFGIVDHQQGRSWGFTIHKTLATRRPVPSTINTMALPLAHPPRFTISCTIVERSDV